MEDVKMLRGRISNLQPFTPSRKGHPRWKVVITDGKRKTAVVTGPKSPLAYKVPAYLNQRVTARARMYYGNMTLTSIRKEYAR